MRDLNRLLRARHAAVLGGGAWCEAVMAAARRMGFAGELWPVHPAGKQIGGKTAVTDISELPVVPDAVFLGINRHATIETVARLRDMGAGGAICFASGFTEALAEDASGANLQAALIQAAGDMPILGPNCYGFINALDQVALWPDEHDLKPVDRGVAILTQSSNIGLNLTFQTRGIPVAYMVAVGNMAQTSAAQIAQVLAQDSRVSAIGLYAEGFGDLRQWEAFAKTAHDNGVPVVVLKSGRSEQAQAAAVSHTASLAGQDAGAEAFLSRLGFARSYDLPGFLETLNLLDMVGPLPDPSISTISCSGGEAGLVADMAVDTTLGFPDLTDAQLTRLRNVLGPRVALANPLDYHTYIWRDVEAMSDTWAAMMDGASALTVAIVDYPTTDATDWACATEAALRAHAGSGRPLAVASTLGELMPGETADALRAGGVVPIRGLGEALRAAEAAAKIGAPVPEPVLLPQPGDATALISEAQAKAMLADHDVSVPRTREMSADCIDVSGLTAPFAVKAVGLAHKSDSGGVRLGVHPADLTEAVSAVGTDTVLVEEMIDGAVAEILVSVLHDPAHGFLLTVGAGGTLTELWQDSQSCLLPASRDHVRDMLQSLRIAPLLRGYRGAPAADLDALLDLIENLQDFVADHAATVREVELNPVLCTPRRAVAVDALIRTTDPSQTTEDYS